MPPCSFRRTYIEPARLADPAIALLHFLADVGRAAANAPLVHAGVAAERAPRLLHRPVAPAADRLPCGVALRLPPVVCRDGAPTHVTHAESIGARAIGD